MSFSFRLPTPGSRAYTGGKRKCHRRPCQWNEEMTREELQEDARRQPFRPLRIVLTTGEMFDVLHADLIMVGRRSVAIGITNDNSAPAYDRLVRADLLHVVRTEELPGVPSSNGLTGN
jgi:hypothetical protein